MSTQPRVPATKTPPPHLAVSRFIVQVICVDEHHAIKPWPVDEHGNQGSFIFEGNSDGDPTKHLVDWATEQLPAQLATSAGDLDLAPPAPPELTGKTKAELRAIAKKLGLKISGNVNELTARIAAAQAATP